MKSIVLCLGSIVGLWLITFGYNAILNLSDIHGIVGVIAKILSFSWVPGSGRLGFSLIPLIAVGILSFKLIMLPLETLSSKWIKYVFPLIVTLFFSYEGITNLFINANESIMYERLGYIQLVTALVGFFALYKIKVRESD